MEFAFRKDGVSDWLNEERGVQARHVGSGPGGRSQWELVGATWSITLGVWKKWPPEGDEIKVTTLIVTDSFTGTRRDAEAIAFEFLDAWRNTPISMKGRQVPKAIVF